jgi:hypothetical protein
MTDSVHLHLERERIKEMSSSQLQHHIGNLRGWLSDAEWSLRNDRDPPNRHLKVGKVGYYRTLVTEAEAYLPVRRAQEIAGAALVEQWRRDDQAKWEADQVILKAQAEEAAALKVEEEKRQAAERQLAAERAAHAAVFEEFRYRLAVGEGITDEATIRERFEAVTRRIEGPS